jgi:hypothetical protein
METWRLVIEIRDREQRLNERRETRKKKLETSNRDWRPGKEAGSQYQRQKTVFRDLEASVRD